MTELDELKSKNAILKERNIFLQELYYAEKEKVKKAKQKCINLAKALQTAKAEARKEFAERLKELGARNSAGLIIFVESKIDNLLKEMESESNGII